MRGTTNEDRRFEPGEVVQFAGEDYVVERNFGPCGAVAALAHGIRIVPFWWVFGGEPARRTGERFAVRMMREPDVTRGASS
ncbi:MAG: hypothetical protein U1F10_07065 [Burkholderiales bacterium]